MPRLIDANELLKRLEWLEEYDYIIYGDVKHYIDDTPTVDAEPVVRCKDCKWFRFNKTAVWCDNERGLVEPRYDSFCSYGERKEDETDRC